MEWLRYGCAVLRLQSSPVAVTDSEAVMSTIREPGLSGKSLMLTASGLGQHRTMLDRMGRSPLVWQLSSPSPFYSPPSPRRVFSDRVKTLSNCLTRSCSLLRVRQKGQRGPERDDERGRDEGWEGWRRGCQLSWVTLPSKASWPNITGAWQRQMWWGEVAIKEQIHTLLTVSSYRIIGTVLSAR